ncbi:MAG: SDR family oxidoreductase [Saprospiraceae bacterium]|nr:SDR family oxidoreductase [Saprospiraceae bacterium]
MNILIIGGASGLGKATVELLAQDKKHKIWFTYFTSQQNADFLKEKYDNVLPIYIDITLSVELDNFCKKINEMNLDVLINSAYVGSPTSSHFHKIDSTEFVASFTNNLIPIIKITQTAIQGFKQKRFGKIINVLSSSILNSPPIGYSIYGANKAYLHQLSKSWNKEYIKYNITSNCISPEFMDTGFSNMDERIIEKMKIEHPLKQILTVDEVSSVIKFLVDSSQQINGVNIPINASNY